MHMLENPLPAAQMIIYEATNDPETSDLEVLAITNLMIRAMQHGAIINKYSKSTVQQAVSDFMAPPAIATNIHTLKHPLPAAQMVIYEAIHDQETSDLEVLAIAKLMMKVMDSDKITKKYSKSPLLTENCFGWHAYPLVVYAIKENRPSVVEFFLRAIQTMENKESLMRHSERYLSMSLLSIAAKNNNLAIVKLVHSFDREAIHIQDAISSKKQRYETPLMHAVKNGSVEMCEVLLRLGADGSINYSCSEYFESALSIAIKNNDYAICELLIRHGADAAKISAETLEGSAEAINHLIAGSLNQQTARPSKN